MFSKILYFIEKEGRVHTDNISRTRKKKHSHKPLVKELKLYRDQGVLLYLNGEPSTPKNIAKACQIAEGGNYMRDYISDEKGRIARVDFDFVDERKRS